MSDRTWGRLGRRRPYFLIGALLATAALVVMPNSPYLWIAAGMLWILDASINISMEPFRALVGDMLPGRQRCLGYSMQSWFIGVGAVVASALPWILVNVLRRRATSRSPESCRNPSSSLFTSARLHSSAPCSGRCLTTREYPPDELAAFAGTAVHARACRGHGADAGAISAFGHGLARRRTSCSRRLVAGFGWDKQLYVLGFGLAAFGALQLLAAARQQRGQTEGMLHSIVNDLFLMPRVMRQLAVVQFLSWFALFAMWIYTTAAVTAHHYGTTDHGFCRLQRGRQLGRRAVRGLQRLCRTRRAVHSDARRQGRPPARAPGRAMVRRARPDLDTLHRRSAVAARVDGRRRHRVGVDPVTAVRDAVPGRAGAEDGHLHGDLQFLHRDSADPRGERARHLRARAVRRRTASTRSRWVAR